MKNNFLKIGSRILFVPKCSSCNCRMPVISDTYSKTQGFAVLCDKCLPSFLDSTTELCLVCNQPSGKCTCVTQYKGIKQNNIPSLFYYHPDRINPSNNVIYTMKHKCRQETFDYIGLELSDQLSKSDVDLHNCILTYIPRTRSAILKYGFDQAHELCLRLSQQTDKGELYHLFERCGGGEQKKLNKKQRDENIKESVFLNRKYFSRDGVLKKSSGLSADKTVIIVDDVITSGATVSRGISLLRGAGFKRIFVCCVARTQTNDKN